MLLLSSATRILATKRPPDANHPYFTRAPHSGRLFNKSPQYWSTLRICRQSQRGTRVSEVNMASRSLSWAFVAPNNKGCRSSSTPGSHPRYLFLKNYQGTSLRSPFFFLLLDSFLESLLVCESPVFAASAAGAVPAASLFDSVPAASVFAGVSVAPSAAGGFFAASSVVAVLAFVGATTAVAGAVPASFGGSLVAGGLPAPSLVVPSVPAGATFSDGAVVSPAPLPPAVPVAISPVPPTPSLDFPPGDSRSAVVIVSVSGSMLGSPVLAAARNSSP